MCQEHRKLLKVVLPPLEVQVVCAPDTLQTMEQHFQEPAAHRESIAYIKNSKTNVSGEDRGKEPKVHIRPFHSIREEPKYLPCQLA